MLCCFVRLFYSWIFYQLLWSTYSYLLLNLFKCFLILLFNVFQVHFVLCCSFRMSICQMFQNVQCWNRKKHYVLSYFNILLINLQLSTIVWDRVVYHPYFSLKWEKKSFDCKQVIDLKILSQLMMCNIIINENLPKMVWSRFLFFHWRIYLIMIIIVIFKYFFKE